MIKSTVIFDLDGTITDPSNGITRCINHALAALGYPTRAETDLRKYIGPHLNTTFSDLMQTSDEVTLTRAIELYRERYIPVGYRENRLYKRVREVLATLYADGSKLCVATAKRTDSAESVLKFLQIDQFFIQVHGCGLHRRKSDLLHNIRSDAALSANAIVMIGDRATDFEAAQHAGIPFIAVRWGYGTRDELEMATFIAETPAELPELVNRAAQPLSLGSP